MRMENKVWLVYHTNERLGATSEILVGIAGNYEQAMKLAEKEANLFNQIKNYDWDADKIIVRTLSLNEYLTYANDYERKEIINDKEIAEDRDPLDELEEQLVYQVNHFTDESPDVPMKFVKVTSKITKFDASKHYDELLEIMEPDIGTETGNDGIVYGTYIDWSSVELTDDKYVSLIDLMGIEKEVWELLQDEKDPTGLLEDKSFDDLDIEDIVDIASELGALDDVYGLMVDEGLPNETEYENGNSDFPEDLRYYKQDYDDYNAYAEKVNEFEDQYLDLMQYIEKIDSNGNQEELKDRLTVAYMRIEDFLKQAFVKILPKPQEYKMPNVMKMVIEERYTESIRDINGEKFKKLFQKVLPSVQYRGMSNRDLRNALAHNRSKVLIQQGNIEYKKNNGKDTNVQITTILSSMKEHVKWIHGLGDAMGEKNAQ